MDKYLVNLVSIYIKKLTVKVNTPLKDKKYDKQDLKRLRNLERENQKLKQMYADVSLDNKMLKDILSKKF